MSCFILTLTLTIFLFFHSPATVSGATNSSNTVTYHGGPLLTGDITVTIIWYGSWKNSHKTIIKEFITSISGSEHRSPSVYSWWKTVRLYTDYTGTNISSNVKLGREITDSYSHGYNLTRAKIKAMVEFAAATDKTEVLPDTSELYLFLTSEEVRVDVDGFCQVCSLHDSTDGSVNGYRYMLPYAWVGYAAKLCPYLCTYPFTVPDYLQGILKPLKSPNGLGIDSVVNAIAQEIVGLVTNPFTDGWYRDLPGVQESTADVCVGIYGRGGGPSYPGDVLRDRHGASYNIHGIKKKFLVQWVWNPVVSDCTGS